VPALVKAQARAGEGRAVLDRAWSSLKGDRAAMEKLTEADLFKAALQPRRPGNVGGDIQWPRRRRGDRRRPHAPPRWRRRIRSLTYVQMQEVLEVPATRAG
jgi:hypothetical protein